MRFRRVVSEGLKKKLSEVGVRAVCSFWGDTKGVVGSSTAERFQVLTHSVINVHMYIKVF